MDSAPEAEVEWLLQLKFQQRARGHGDGLALLHSGSHGADGGAFTRIPCNRTDGRARRGAFGCFADRFRPRLGIGRARR